LRGWLTVQELLTAEDAEDAENHLVFSARSAVSAVKGSWRQL
jgi:hypothetical protein